jgi:hypothetical protein
MAHDTNPADDAMKHQGGQGPGQGRGANPGEVHPGHADEATGEEGTGPGRTTTGAPEERSKERRRQQQAEERSNEADAGVASEQEGRKRPGADKQRQRDLGDAGIATH